MMPTRNDVGAVIALLQEINGPDRKLDRAVMALFFVREHRLIGTMENSGPAGAWVPVEDSVWIDPKTDRWVTTDMDGYEFTRSMDEAVRLVQRVFPGCVWSVSNSDGHGNARGSVRLNPLTTVEANEATPALSLVCATLQALEIELRP